jgi:hypothetical protein
LRGTVRCSSSIAGSRARRLSLKVAETQSSRTVVWKLDHVLGKYVIADRPMTEQEWVEAKADVIEVTPEKEPPAE